MNSLKHVAIIMDGNGRWAKQRHRPRLWGHVRGSSLVSKIVEAADDLGIKALTLYAFSTENWKRPEDEINGLFKLLKKFLLKERARLIKNQIQFKVIGDYSKLPVDTINLIKDLEQTTSSFDGLKLSFAFNYGSRKEIIDAVNRCIDNNPNQHLTEEMLNNALYRPEIGDVDLLIRTGGEQRISNYLLWQMAYAELYFTDTKWPDFNIEEFKNIITLVQNRERRFGATSEQIAQSQLTSNH